MPRYWVKIPGEEKPIDLPLEELVARQRAGKLPAGTLAVAQGAEAWASVESIEEVKLALEEARTSNAPPSSAAAQGVDLFEAPPSLGVGPTMLGGAPTESPNAPMQPQVAPLPPPPPPPRRGRPFLALLAVAALVLFGSGSLLCVWLRYGYTHAAVFDHVPSDCAVLEYVDFGAIDDTPAVRDLKTKRERALADWDDDLDDADGPHGSLGDDAYGRSATLSALKKSGFQAYGDVKEVAYCEVHDEGEAPATLLVVGGTFRGKDTIAAIKNGILRRDKKKSDDDDLKTEDVDGRTWLRLDSDRWATMPTSQIVLIGPRKLLEKHLSARPVARAYGLKDEIILRHLATDAVKGGGPTEERWTFAKGKLTFTRESPVAAGAVDAVKATLDGYKALAERMRNIDGLDAIADGWANADVKQDGDTLRTTITWSGSELSSAMKALVESDIRELKPLVEALRGTVGADYFHDAIVPGVDAFGMHLSPW